MYGLPDSAVVGTAKRLGRMSQTKKSRNLTTYEGGESEVIARWIARREQKARAKRQQKRLERKQEKLARKHKVRFF